MNKLLQFISFIILYLNLSLCTNAQTTISAGSCLQLAPGALSGCSTGGLNWAKVYNLSDFGKDANEEFVVSSGSIGIYGAGVWGVNLRFNIYEIDSNFPASFSEANLIGSSQIIPLSYWGSNSPRVISTNFSNNIVIPSNVNLILVEVEQLVYNGSSAATFAANSTDNSTLSWCRSESPGCLQQNYATTIAMGFPDVNFYITISGFFNKINEPFTLNFTDDCNETNKEFFLSNSSNINSVNWNFGDPASGISNTSTLLSPSHNFSSPGEYSITATILQTDQTTYVLNQTISVGNPPIAYPVATIYACEDNIGSGISTSFDTSGVEVQVINGQTGVIVSYYDQNGNELPSPLPNPYTNTQPNSQEIRVRIRKSGDACCFAETSFSFVTNPLPQIIQIDDIFSCDDNSDGYTGFDLSDIPVDLINGQPNLRADLFDSNNAIISTANYNNFVNLVANQDFIKAVITDTNTNCVSAININLRVNNKPIANQLQVLYGCDDNNDGISEYFETSNIESQVLNGQSGMTVSYFDENGNALSSPLPNPFTNTTPFNQNIIVRVTDMSTSCYTETTLHLQTNSQPNINQPNNLYACDQGDGYSEFDTSTIGQQIIGNQTGLIIKYYDSNNNQLPTPLPISFQNTVPYSQTIFIRVEDASNPICYSETSFKLLVNKLPEIDLNKEYFICNLEPSINLTISPNFNTFEWLFEDGTLISSTNNAEIVNEGNYTLTVSLFENGIICEKSFSFSLIRSDSPAIQQINIGEIGNNFIEIIASGDGVFEYSIDGINYQENNYFANIQGGIYTVYVRDKFGCGEDSEEVTVINYPKFFTPNSDGYNDHWQILGISKFPNSKVFIFDRYGKLLTQLSSNDMGWDGYYNGKEMMSSDYWFRADLGNGEVFSGHFTLKR